MKKYKIIIFSVLLGVFLLWPASNNNWGGDNWTDMLGADAKGYYAYLPAVFIYHDLNFGHFDSIEKEKYYNADIYYDYRFRFEGKVVNKYFVGTSILQLPFFLVAHSIALSNSEWDADGFSKPYLISVNVASIFYIAFGIYLLLLVLVPLYGNIVLVISAFSVFATNLYFYGVNEPGMSHAYSFFLVCSFIYFLLKFLELKRFKFLFFAAIVVGLVFLVRPVNGLVVLSVPFILGRKVSLELLGFLKQPKYLIILGFTIGLISSIQFLIYYFQTGSFLVYSYGQEGFNWTNPQILNALFSFKKGALIYTPILWLGIPALVSLWKSDGFRFKAYLLFIIPVLYVLYSWWNWWYGGSFSQRVLIEYYPFLIVLLSMWLKELKLVWVKRMVLAFAILCLTLNQFQTYQYRHYLIHWEDMNKEKYFEVLFKMPE